MPSVHLKTLGCRLNEAELEQWAQGFLRRGWRLTEQAAHADLIVLNSCAVTEDAVRKSRQTIRRLHRDNPHAKLVVSGCYATLHGDDVAQQLGVDLVVGNAEKNQLVETALQKLDFATMPQMASEPGANALFGRGRQRAFIKVQDGCRYRCTFCIVTTARGAERSRPIAEIVAEINHLEGQGVQEIVLTGVHLGGYGSDNQSSLRELLHALLIETSVPRIRLGSLEPWELDEDFFALFADARLMPHLHLPLQSGSDSVLRRMARRCRSAEFAALVEQARRLIPHFNVTSDIIVGFPGETEQEWQDSLAFIERIGFGHLHIFSYSPRTGTAAAAFSDPVPEAIKKQRHRALQYLAARMKRHTLERHLGMVFPVLWEGHCEQLSDGRARVMGYTPNYLRVAVATEAPETLTNRILPARLQRVEDDYVVTTLVESL